MAYSLEIDKDNNLITITYDQTSTYEDRIKALDEAISYLKEEPMTNIFVDASTAGNILTGEQQMELGKLLGKNSMYFRNNKTAVLKPASLHPVALGKAYVNGHKHLVEFDNRREALQWLSGEIK